MLAGRTARLRLDTGAGDVWTLDVADGRVRARRGSPEQPDVAICADLDTLAALVTGRLSCAAAFVDERVVVRGDLALALQLGELFAPPADPAVATAAQGEVMGVRTGWLEAGPRGGPPVILLHGLGASNASMLTVLTDLARDHRVLAPDAPGFGSSDAPASSPYSSSWFAAWLAAFQTATGSRGAVLVGNSLGGRIALEAGLQRPGWLRALVLLAPSPAFRRLRQYVPAVRLLSPSSPGCPPRRCPAGSSWRACAAC